jgi:predicted dehydrogenase
MAVSRNPETAAIIPAGCRLLDRWQDMIEDRSVDGIVIATPPATHAEIIAAAIESGKPILVEKPVVQSHAEASRIRAILGRRQVPILVDHVHLFHPAFRALCREAAKLGPVRSINSAAGNHGPYRTDVSVLWDWAPHDLAMCLTLVPGSARAVAATCLETKTMNGIPAERIGLELALDGAVPARIQASTIDERHRWFAATLDDCTLVYRDAGGPPLIRLPADADIQTGAGTEIPVVPESPLTRAVLDFAAAIRERSVDLSSINLGLTVVDLLLDFDVLLGTDRNERTTPGGWHRQGSGQPRAAIPTTGSNRS